jgi:hypothetical protein
MRQLHKLLRLAPDDRQLLIQVLLLMSAIRLGLWLLPFRILRRWLNRLSHPQPGLRTVTIERVVWAVEVVSHFMPGGVMCLARALTTQILLSWQGYLTQLRIGVAKTQAGQLEAHAWVESQGQIIIGELADLARFTPLPALEGERV